MAWYKVLGALCITLSMSGFSYAEQQCKTIHWKPNMIYSVKAALHKATHIVLPEPMIVKPVSGNANLWNIEGTGTHLFVKPNSKMKEGSETTVTVIGAINTYDFLLKRVINTPDICVVITEDGELLGKDFMTSYEQNTTGVYKKQIRDLQERLSQSQMEATKTVEQALMKYRPYIYTRYKWSEGDGFMGKKLISDVWDDGRFTYIRLFTDNKGLLTLSAYVDDKKEFVDYSYDEENKIYKIAGIFPKLILKYGKSSVKISRTDNMTIGAY